jgi:UDP-2-acetamido-3-amino-2,3-dideoxy-glucuronate N-acetyltransferase
MPKTLNSRKVESSKLAGRAAPVGTARAAPEQKKTRRPGDIRVESAEKRTMPVADTVKLGENVVIFHPDLVNLYGCTIGDETRIGTFVEIQKNARIGRRCKIQSHTFICEGVTVEDEVFIGHGVMFVNDLLPRATVDGRLATEADWTVVPTLVKKGATLGSGAVILGGITIGERAMVGAGAVVTADVPPGTLVYGVPARLKGLAGG